jgi:4-hydroxy-tetrahydrodipicolinate synthase
LNSTGFFMFHGSIVALVTPMNDHGKIDFEAYQRLIDLHLSSATNCIVVAGTTGESASLSQSEFCQLLKLAVEQVDSKIPVLAGTGSPDTARAVSKTRLAAELGADGALVVTPYYNRPMQSGLLAHYHTLADETSIPLVIYNVPSRTSVDIMPETVAELAQRDEIVAIKEAVPDPQRISALVSLCGDSLNVLSGDDPSCLESMRLGAKGVVSVAANVAPERFQAMCRYAGENHWAAALEIDDTLRHLYGILALEANPIPVKYALYRLGFCGSGIRLPLLPLSQKYHAQLEQGLHELGLVRNDWNNKT